MSLCWYPSQECQIGADVVGSTLSFYLYHADADRSPVVFSSLFGVQA